MGKATARTQGDDQLIGVSKNHKDIIKQIDKYAKTDENVLIIGETGTGKELIARAIHRQSPRKEQPFIAVNCAAIPETLVESELFGHEKGAFTGAFQHQKGKFELANKGTIFLDEIGDMPLFAQAKILRVLQDYEITRVGGVSPIKTDVRVIAATNRDPMKEIGAGRFREDLYYRLNVVEIHVPPLRERREDVIAILNHYAKGRIDPKVKAYIYSSELRGNVRELKSLSDKEFSEIENSVDKNLKKYCLDLSDDHLKTCLIEYEICTLRAAGVSKNEIAKILCCRREVLTKKWQTNYGISLDDFISRHKIRQNKLFYPDFFERICLELRAHAAGVYSVE